MNLDSVRFSDQQVAGPREIAVTKQLTQSRVDGMLQCLRPYAAVDTPQTYPGLQWRLGTAVGLGKMSSRGHSSTASVQQSPYEIDFIRFHQAAVERRVHHSHRRIATKSKQQVRDGTRRRCGADAV
ncbi:MAG: hypothetical protein ACRDT8_15620, partial [Micromonosporaceae bacterium]